MKNNPYVGPRPYERADRRNFYGRGREARDLLSLMLAERVLLFYAQSGAGKTSLLNALVIPALEDKGFDVLPVARVGSDLPPGIDPAAVPNIFVFSALMGLAGADVDPQTLLEHTLLSFLQIRCCADNPPLLIFDQFEELFTTHRDRWQEARDFFVQVRQCLDDIPNLGVTLAMREDHIAELDPYAALLPGRLRARFRMERLGPQAAVEAVARPAANAGCPFDPGVAERLVDDLQRIKMQEAGSRMQDAGGEGQERGGTSASLPLGGIEGGTLGPYVEPVQLQVVCNRLWERLPDQHDNAIQWAEVEQYGNIDRALVDFYESALTEARNRVFGKNPVSERQLRRWFSEELITPMDTRGLVMRGRDDTAGLPNAAVDALEAQHLIRADARAGARWYELCHDRMVDPILVSNRGWEQAQENLHPWRPVARQWETSPSETLLYRGKELAAAQSWLAAAGADEVEGYERAFIEASGEAERARRRRRQLYITGGVIAVVLMVAMATLTFWAINNQLRAENAELQARTRLLAAQGQDIFEDNPLLGIRLTLEGLALAPPEDTIVRGVLVTQMEGMAQYGRLLNLGSDVEGVYPSPDHTLFVLDRKGAKGELRRIIDGSIVMTLTDEIVPWEGPCVYYNNSTSTYIHYYDVIFGPDPNGTYFAVNYADARCELRRTVDGTVVSSNISEMYFSYGPDADFFVVSYVDAPGELRRTADGAVVMGLKDNIKQVTFSSDPNATYFVVSYDNARGELRRTIDGSIVMTLTDQVQDVQFSPDPNATYFFVSYDDGRSELRSTANSTIIPFTANEVCGAVFSPEPRATHFVVIYCDAAPELRHIADDLAVPLKGDIIFYTSYGWNWTYFMVSHTDGSYELRRTANGDVVAKLAKEIFNIEFSPDPNATYFMVEYADGSRELRRTADGLVVPLRSDIRDVTFSQDPNATYFVVYYTDGSGELRRTANGDVVAKLADNIARVWFSPDPNMTYFVVDFYGDAFGELRRPELRRTSSGAPIKVFTENGILNTNFSPDTNATYFVVSYSSAAGELRRSADGDVIAELAGLSYADFSPDQNTTYFVAEYGDGHSQLWHIDGYPLIDLGSGKVRHFFDPDARRLVVEYNDGQVYLLDLDWLTTMKGNPAAFSAEELTRIICEGPMALGLFDESVLTSYLGGHEPQACRLSGE